MIKFIEKDDSVIFKVRVIPRASKSKIVGEYDEFLKVKLAAPPVDGAANKALVKILAKALGVSKSEVVILCGETSKTKTIELSNLALNALVRRLNKNFGLA